MESDVLVDAIGISHGFDTVLFEDIDFKLKSSQSVAIVGRSGCGKSTLMHILSSFIKPDTGTVNLFDKNIYIQPDSYVESLRRYDIGMIFQFHYLFKGMSAFDNINMANKLSGEKIDKEIWTKLEIDDIITNKISELSGGQQQRVSTARVLAKKPRIIFADEPTGNLDKETAVIVLNVLLDYIEKYNAGLILITHDESIAARCDSVYRLEGKRLVEIK